MAYSLQLIQSQINVVFESVLENDTGFTSLKFMGVEGAQLDHLNPLTWIHSGWARRLKISY